MRRRLSFAYLSAVAVVAFFLVGLLARILFEAALVGWGLVG